jgi:UDPglucose 6-dehydrogenase
VRMTVIGCGHLGATHAACMAEIGHDVLGVDIDDGKIRLLNSGRAWFHEPGLDDMLARNIAAGRLRFSTSFAETAGFAAVHFLGVATPASPAGSYDLAQVGAAIRSLAPYLGPSLIIGKSTVPPGTAASLRLALAKIAPAAAADIAWNPEFLREGYAVADTLRPDRIVIGTATGTAEATLREIYRPLTDAGIPLITTGLATAELVKGAANAFLAAKISFINTMADLCAAVGADTSVLAGALGMDPRIGPDFLRAGIGYGGACLPKDVQGLAAFARGVGVHSASELLMTLDRINIGRRDRVIQIIGEAARKESVPGSPAERSPIRGKKIGIWGAAFKPGTDDVRDSPGLDIAHRLHQLGAQVTIYDPMAVANAFAAFPHLSYADSALAAAHSADLLVVVTAWPEFARVDPAAVASATLIDACQGIEPAAWRDTGWKVISLTSGQQLHNAQPRSPHPAHF